MTGDKYRKELLEMNIMMFIASFVIVKYYIQPIRSSLLSILRIIELFHLRLLEFYIEININQYQEETNVFLRKLSCNLFIDSDHLFSGAMCKGYPAKFLIHKAKPGIFM